MSNPRISVAIITKNEVADIGACLKSVSDWTTEIVVVDSGSTDGTQEICRRFGAMVIETPDWPGFGRQKNRAIEACTGDWILSLDADETVPPKLRDEILTAARSDGNVAFRIPRLSSFCGRDIHHSGWRPDYVTRLFRSGTAKFSDDLVHERLTVAGDVGTLKESLMHASFDSIEELIDKINAYSTAGARMLHQKERKASMSSAVLRASWAFFRTYVLRLGFLDGREGFIIAFSAAEGTFYKYVKQMLMLEQGDDHGRRA